MLHLFSEEEREYLETLKKNLILPKKYFFHRYKDFTDFKKINERMWYWQWHYLYSAGTLFANTLKYLGKAFYSLLSLQFSVAGQRFTEAGKLLGSAVVKLSLDIGLLCLHLTRFLSLFIATFFPELAYFACMLTGLVIAGCSFPIIGVVGLFLGLAFFALGVGLWIKSIVTPNADFCANVAREHTDTILYQNLHEEVMNERAQWILELERISARQLKPVAKEQTYQGCEAGLFAEKKLPVDILRAKAEVSELVNKFLTSLDEYPTFSMRRAQEEPYYIAELYNELMEHHSKVKVLAEEYFHGVDIPPLSKESQSTLSVF